jgi:SAM-dependent methyltransferase
VASKPEDETALYDDPEFFAAYDDMRALEGTLNEIVETPALVSLMPKLQGIMAADLGCGMGAMCHWLIAQGAASVVGFDSSEKMLARAKQESPTIENLRFEHAELDRIDLAESSFHLIVSGLALHYAADFQKIARRVSLALRPGGSFIFSVEHPIITCGERNWVLRDDGARAHWPVDHYLDEGSRKVSWLGFVDVPRYHRTVSSYVNALLDAGLLLKRLNEPGPSRDDMTNWPRLKDQRRRPPFLVIRADKPSHG